MPKVSVVIPTHNREGLLRVAMESVLAQTFRDFEIIVVDDGSTDGTAKAVREFSDGRVRYFHLEHGERSRARNFGLEKARGDYVAFLDDDDVCLPNRLSSQGDFLSRHPDVGLVGSGCRIIDDEGRTLAVRRPWVSRSEPTLRMCLSACAFVPPTCAMFRREALEPMDRLFDKSMNLAEDIDFWIRMIHAGCRPAWAPEVVSGYRIRQNVPASFAVGYMIACKNMLDSYFKRSDVPRDIMDARDVIYGQALFTMALRGYAGGLPEMGKRFLAKAVNLKPSLLEEEPPKIISAVARYAGLDLLERDREDFLKSFFDALPDSLTSLADYRDEAGKMLEPYRDDANLPDTDDSPPEAGSG